MDLASVIPRAPSPTAWRNGVVTRVNPLMVSIYGADGPSTEMPALATGLRRDDVVMVLTDSAGHSVVMGKVGVSQTQSGMVTVGGFDPEVNERLSQRVDFPDPFPGTSTPRIGLSMSTAYPHVWSVGVMEVDTRGFTLWVAKEAGTNVALPVGWIAHQA